MKDREAYSSGKPIRAMIEVSRVCNLQCPACPVGNRTAKSVQFMPLNQYERIVDHIFPTIKELALFNYGEPLLHPQIGKMVKYAKNNSIKHVRIHSNGLPLNDEMIYALIEAHLDKIKISIDAAHAETYMKYRQGGDFNKLLRNLSRFVEIRNLEGLKFPKIVAQFIVMSHNEKEIVEFHHLMTEIGVDAIKYKTFNAHMSSYEKSDRYLSFLPANSKYSRYRDRNAKNIKEQYKRKECHWPWEYLVVNADGTIIPCCYDFNARYQLGSFTQNNDWWETRERIDFRNKLETDANCIDMCQHCPTGTPDLGIKEIKLEG